MNNGNRAVSLVVLILLIMSTAVVLIGSQARRAEAALSYQEEIDSSTRGERDGGTKVFLRASGNVGVASEGVGLLGALTAQNKPVSIENRVPLGAQVKRAYLYWGGNFGTYNGPAPNKYPSGSDKMYFDGMLLKGSYLGYEYMDDINHRRLFRAEVTDRVQGKVNEWNRKGNPAEPLVFYVRTVADSNSAFTDKAWWGASIVVVFTHVSITQGKVCVADGCNIMNIPGTAPTPDNPRPDHIKPYTATGFQMNNLSLPSADKGIIASEGALPDAIGYKFVADGGANPCTIEAILQDQDGDSWSDLSSADDPRLDIKRFVTPLTSQYSVDMWNADVEGAYCDLYVDWFWFAARMDFDISKKAELVVDADKNRRVSPGDTLEYTLSYGNGGQTEARDVYLTDEFDTSLVAYASGISGGVVPDNGKITWHVGRLPGGSPTYTRSYRVTLKSGNDFAPTGDVTLSRTARLFDRQTGYQETAEDPVVVSNPVNPRMPKLQGAKTWYLAEGSTGADENGSFETWVLLQNAGSVPAKARITYMTPQGEKKGPSPTLAPGTRQTFNVAGTVPGEWSVSTKVTSDQPIIAERAMYWNTAGGPYRQAAHDSIGVTSPANTWFLAEGSTGSDDRGRFETWVLVQNPGEKKAKVKITYMTPEGEKEGPSPTIEPGTRQTFNVADTVPDTWSISAKVDSNEPIIAERAMYWNGDGAYRQAAHDSIGVTNSSKNWYLAEGSTGSDDKGGFETWVLLQNPGEVAAKAKITYMTPQGMKEGPSPELEPGTRQTFNVADTVPGEWDVSTKVTSDQPIIAERAVYWNSSAGVYRQAAHDCVGVAVAGTTWFLAEGSTGSNAEGGFETWVLVQNPGQAAANVSLTYMTAGGSVNGPTVQLRPGTRQSINVATTVPNNWSVSTKVSSDQPIIAERAVYWNSSAGVYRQAATDSIGLDP